MSLRANPARRRQGARPIQGSRYWCTKFEELTRNKLDPRQSLVDPVFLIPTTPPD
ncbi:MAG: hypothetical protein M1824_003366, partial [Vezdaea acicularis]